MNPLLVLLPLGAAILLLSSKKEEKKKPSGEVDSSKQGGADTSKSDKTSDATAAPSTEPSFASTSYEFSDKNGVVWVITNTFPSVWEGKVKSDPMSVPGYEKAWDPSMKDQWMPKGASKDIVESMIQILAIETKSAVEKQATEGKAAGIADANASIQAYKDSKIGFRVNPVYPRWNKDMGIAWRNAYNKGFDDQIEIYGYKIEKNGPCCDKWYIFKPFF